MKWRKKRPYTLAANIPSGGWVSRTRLQGIKLQIDVRVPCDLVLQEGQIITFDLSEDFLRELTGHEYELAKITWPEEFHVK